MPKKLANMTVEELEARNRELMEQKDAIREEQRELHEHLAVAQAREKVEAMSDAERAALAQAVESAGGIESEGS